MVGIYWWNYLGLPFSLYLGYQKINDPEFGLSNYLPEMPILDFYRNDSIYFDSIFEDATMCKN